VTDDTAAFQAAANTRKPLRVTRPAVRYRVTGTVYVYNSVIGDGSMPEIRLSSPTGDWNDSIFQILGYSGTGATFSGLNLNGGWDGTASMEHSHGIGIGGSRNVTVENNVIQNMRGDNVYIGSNPLGSAGAASSNILVRNNDLRNARRCNVAVINANGVTIAGNKMQKSNNFVTAIDVEPNPNGNDSAWNITIDRNTFNNPSAVAILLYHASGWAIPSGGLGGNIKITNNSGDSSYTGVSISSAGGWVNVTQSNNVWH
jgi:hypothetical protein